MSLSTRNLSIDLETSTGWSETCSFFPEVEFPAALLCRSLLWLSMDASIIASGIQLTAPLLLTYLLE